MKYRHALTAAAALLAGSCTHQAPTRFALTQEGKVLQGQRFERPKALEPKGEITNDRELEVEELPSPRAARGPASVAGTRLASNEPHARITHEPNAALKRLVEKLAPKTERAPMTSTSPTAEDTEIARTTRVDGNLCRSVEYGALSPRAVPGGTRNLGQWARMQVLFLETQGQLLQWLTDNREKISKQTYEQMRHQLQTARLEQARPETEPDLSWRGAGIWSQQPSQAATLRLGDGFATLLERQPKRARFELARLLAQVWAPCELRRAGIGGFSPWNSYLSCMGFKESSLGCEAGNYSEAGWAVSSAIALKIAPPGCQIPAFAEESRSECTRALFSPAANPAALVSQKEKSQ